MTKKQAFLAAMRGEQPDIVPVAPLLHCRYALKHLGRHDWRAVFEIHQEIGSTHYRGPVGLAASPREPDGYSRRDEIILEDGPHRINRHFMESPLGTLTSTYEVGMIPGDPLVGKQTEYAVKEPKQWEILIRKWNEEAEGPALEPGEGIAEACRVMGEDGVPSVSLGSAYGAMGNYRGMKELLFDLEDEPDLMAEVARAAWRSNEKMIDAFIASPSEACYYDICWATGSHIGPERFERWVGDEIRKACHKVRAAGKLISFYTLGRIGKLMDVMVDAGRHMIASFEPNEGDITLAEAKKKYGKRICLMGNFDCLVLARGTLDDARREAKRCLDEAMEGGGYILGTADEVPADTQHDNLRAMVEVVQQHGRY